MPVTFIALGANQRRPLQQLQSALTKLRNHPRCCVQACSRFYWSPAVGPGLQADYLNAVLAMETALAPHDLLRVLQAIERRHGRVRGVRWSARPLDLDIVLYGDQQLSDTDLQIPHRQMKNRRFVLRPLFDLRPDLILPNGLPLRNALRALNSAQTGAGALRLSDRKPL